MGAPEELSAKVPVGRFKNVITVPSIRYKPRDPRFDETAGAFSPTIFASSYAFLNDYKTEEAHEMKKQLKKVKSKTKTEELKGALKEAKILSTKDKTETLKRHALQQVKKEQQKQRSAGSNPFYLKKSQEALLGLGARYLELKKTGKLTKVRDTPPDVLS